MGPKKLIQPKLASFFLVPPKTSENNAPQLCSQDSSASCSADSQPAAPTSPRISGVTTAPTAAVGEAEVGHSNASASAHSPHLDTPRGLCAYERERLANIERNEQVLRALGLLEVPSLIPPPPACVNRAIKRPRPSATAVPVRRSLRTRSAGNVSTDAQHGERQDVLAHSAGSESEDSDGGGDDDDCYADSSVVRYMCSSDPVPPSSLLLSAAATSASAPLNLSTSATAFRCSLSSQLHAWRPSGCSADTKPIYSIDSYGIGSRPLLACAGKEGIVSVFPADELTKPRVRAPGPPCPSTLPKPRLWAELESKPP